MWDKDPWGTICTKSGTWSVSRITSIVEDQDIPVEYKLVQNYPNPFNPITTIVYQLPQTSEVNIMIFDIMGNKVQTLVSETQTAGAKSVVWNGTDKFGKQMSSGIYIYRLKADDYVKSRKMVFMK